ncbi:DUF1844 domain-containing protein [Candidatus Sumerlaeota bacterium]|nr:DUF1844 domain-containing protein [Candidatus Sumerlaeota bacterium]
MTEPDSDPKPEAKEESVAESGDKPETPQGETQEPGPKPEAARSQAAELPAPTFASLVEMLFLQGMMASGLAPNPATGKTETDLPMMKLHIGLIEMLEEKTKGNLSAEETSVVSESLHALRMAYLEGMKKK